MRPERLVLLVMLCACRSSTPITKEPHEPPKPAAASNPCPDDMAHVAGGTFRLRVRGDEVTVKGFCMDRSEVTVERYRACVAAKKCSGDHLGEENAVGDPSPDAKCNFPHADRGNHPINCVSHLHAEAFCTSIGRRLPTEEEWEWAARGGERASRYPWGDAEPQEQLCWSGVTTKSGTCPVGAHPTGDTPLGIHDLLGNVWEWTSTSVSTSFVLHGGGWADPRVANVDVGSRSWHNPHVQESSVGFRCAR
jgi:formylglycine-generating enzyme